MKKALKIICLILILYICLASFCGCNTNKTDKIETIEFHYFRYSQIKNRWFNLDIAGKTSFDKQDELGLNNYSAVIISLKDKIRIRAIIISLLSENDTDIELNVKNQNGKILVNSVIKLKANEIKEQTLIFENSEKLESFFICNVAETEEQHNQKYKIKILDII